MHTTGDVPTHVPETSHLSTVVQALLSLHVRFSDTGFEHTPVAGLHIPTLWHWSDAVQVFGVPGLHTPV